MLTNNIGTLLYSFLKGKKIGQDKIGNKFYVHKKNKNKKWVLYKNNIDPTSIDVQWQIWLTDIKSAEPLPDKKNNFKWQKNKQANPTGTLNSYHPKISIDKRKKSITNDTKSSIWNPK